MYERLKALEAKNVKTVDSTCAFVKKIHKTVEEESYRILKNRIAANEQK